MGYMNIEYWISHEMRNKIEVFVFAITFLIRMWNLLANSTGSAVLAFYCGGSCPSCNCSQPKWRHIKIRFQKPWAINEIGRYYWRSCARFLGGIFFEMSPICFFWNMKDLFNMAVLQKVMERTQGVQIGYSQSCPLIDSPHPHRNRLNT